MTQVPDFIEADALVDPSQQVRGLAAALVGKAAELRAMQRAVEALEREVYELSSRTLPDALLAARMDRVGLPELGVDVRLEDWTRALLPKGDVERQAAIDWLVAHDAGSLIKSEVVVAFDRTEHNVATDVAEGLRKRFPDKEVKNRVDVHHMTYTAWAREQREDGVVLPLELLGISIGRVAKVGVRKNQQEEK